MKIDYSPPQISASRNPISVLIAEDQPAEADKVAGKLYLETAHNTGNFQLVHTEIRNFDSDRKALFRFDAVLDSELYLETYSLEREYAVDLTAGNGTPPPQMSFNCRRFVAVFQENTADGLDLNNHDVMTQPVYAIKAHTPFELYDHLAVYPNRLLSHQPETRKHLPGQHHWLWAMADTNEPFVVEWKALYDGLPLESGQVTYQANWAILLPRGIPLHNFWNTKEQPSLIAMEFTFPGTNLPMVRLERAYEGLPFLREFHFGNMLGGLDNFIAYGKFQREEQLQSTDSKRFLDYDYPARAENLKPLQRQFNKHNVLSRVQMTAELGYRTEEEREAAKAIFYSEFAFERRDGKYLPINITSKKAKLNPDGDYRYALQFTYQYAFENHGLWL